MSLAHAKTDHSEMAASVVASIVANATRNSHQTGSKLSTAELLFDAARDMGLQPSWIVPRGLFAIAVDGQEQYINLACTTLNTHTAVSLAKDKYLTRLILERHGLQNIPFARPTTHAEAEAFLHEHGRIVAKPFDGAGARDIHIVTESSQLAPLDISTYILEKYIQGSEYRYLVLNDTVVGVHQSEYGDSVDEHRPLQRIAYAEEQWDEALTSTALHVARILQLRFAAIDFMIGTSGYAYILEVNTNPGLKWFHAPTAGPSLNIAWLVLEAMLENQTAAYPILLSPV